MIPNPICFLLVSSHPIVNFEMFLNCFQDKKSSKKPLPWTWLSLPQGGCGLLPNDESSGDEDLGVANSASEDEEVFPTEELDSIQWGELMISSRRASGAFWHWHVWILPVFVDGSWDGVREEALTWFFRKMELFQKAFGFSFLLLTNCFQSFDPQVLRASCVGFRAMGFWWGSLCLV